MVVRGVVVGVVGACAHDGVRERWLLVVVVMVVVVVESKETE